MNVWRSRVWKTLDWSHLWNNYECRLKGGNWQEVNGDKTELGVICDVAVSGLRAALCDVSSDLTDEDMALWQRHLPLLPGRCSLPTHTADRLKKTQNRNTSIYGGEICAAVRGHKSRSRCAFMIQNDSYSIFYRRWHFCQIFMAETYSISDTSGSIRCNCTEVQLKICGRYIHYLCIFMLLYTNAFIWERYRLNL